jgi:hypothetical protein
MLQRDVGGAADVVRLKVLRRGGLMQGRRLPRSSLVRLGSMKSVNSFVLSLLCLSLLAEQVSRDARGDASDQACGILVMPSASDSVLVGHLDFDLVKAALMLETMTERHLGPMWDRSVKVWVAKVFEGSWWGRQP